MSAHNAPTSGERVRWRIGWQVVWKWTRPDPLVWLTTVAGLVFVVLCIAYGWAAGAALGAAGVAFLLTLYAFLSGHFIMSENVRIYDLRSDDNGGRS